MKYLAVYEVPCMGTVAETFEEWCDDVAENTACETSVKNPHYVSGGYDLYRIVWDAENIQHVLVPVVPE